METETLFTASKWEILKEISHTPRSPLQLSEDLSTTIANVSQQIRLLEVAGLLGKQKVSTRESGKPRSLFSVKKDFSYLIIVSKEGAKKELIEITPKQRLLMNSWLTDNKDNEKIAFSLITNMGDELEGLKGVLINHKRKELFLIHDNFQGIKKNIDRIIKEMNNLRIKTHTYNAKEFMSARKTAAGLQSLSDITVLLSDEYLLPYEKKEENKDDKGDREK